MCSWLVWDSAVNGARSTRVASAIRVGSIGGLTAIEADNFLRRVKWLADAAGIHDQIILNRPPVQGSSIAIYTVSPAARQLTGCDHCNALYDPSLDAVFVELDLIKDGSFLTIYQASPVSSVLSMNDLPFLKTYLDFVLLHEFGHRELHHARSGWFWKSGQAYREREDQADRFAVEHARIAYALPVSSEFVSKTPGGLVEIALEPGAPPGTKADADLLGSIWTMASMMLFLPNPYAPFYSDRAHATFIERILGFIESELQGPNLETGLRGYFLFFKAFLQREVATLSGRMAEIIVPEAIDDISFDEAGLLVTLRKHRGTFHVDAAAIAAARASPRQHRSVISLPEQTRHSEGIGDDWSRAKPRLWSRIGLPTLFFDSDQTYALRDGAFHPYSTFPARSTLFNLWLPPQPSSVSLWEVSGDSPEVRSFFGDSAGSRRAVREIQSEIRRRGLPGDVDLRFVSVAEDRAFLGLLRREENESHLVGVAVLKTANMEVSYAYRLETPSTMKQIGDYNQLAISPTQNGEDVVLITLNEVSEHHYRWSAWKLGQHSAPALIATMPLLLDKDLVAAVPHDLVQDFRPTLLAVAWVPPSGLLIECGGDSVYFLDLKTRQARLVFHPAVGEEGRIRVSSSGLVAIFLQGGYKCFVIDPYHPFGAE